MITTVLGATSDLAEALIYRFAPLSAELHLTARRPGDLAPLCADLRVRELCPVVEAHAIDVQSIDFQLLERLAEKTDLLIVAIGHLGDQRLSEMDDAEAERTFVVNFTGPARAINVFAKKMEERFDCGMRNADCGLEGGNPQSAFRIPQSMIVVSSVAGERGRASNYFYGSAKAGLTAYLSGLRHRLFPKKIRVMTVLPGFMDTKMTAGLPLPRPLTAQPGVAADHIFRAWKRGRRVVYVLPVWRWVMWAVRNLPEAVFLRTKL